MQILVPLAGKSPFFPPEQFFFPKPLIEVAGKPMIERVIENLLPLSDDSRFVFVVPADDVARFSLDRTLQLLTHGRSTIVTLRHPTRGALCSALMAIDQLDRDQPLVIANADQIFDADLSRAIARFGTADAGVVTFDSIHPRWSYVELDERDDVIAAAEKQVISRNAIAGFYYFASAGGFAAAAERTIAAGASVGGSFYVAPALNEVILDGGRVANYSVPNAAFHSFHAPEMVKQYEDLAIRNDLRTVAPTASSRPRLVIPAAGAGSRFAAAGFTRPKPFIDVQGEPMMNHVIRNVSPHDAEVHLLLRREHVDEHRDLLALVDADIDHIHSVDRLTEGTACTLLLARAAIDDDRPLLVANSDQWVDFDVNAYVDDCIDRDLDGSILVFRDPARDPKWSFARLDDEGMVVEVAEKKPISDLATVGIYLFRRGREFVAAAIDMIARNDRVNNEFYTCPVYNYMIVNGARIGVFEIPADAMHGLGTPDDLAAFLERGVDLSAPARVTA